MFDVEPTPLPPPPVELTRYAVAGRYVLEGPLGEGGMGRVHRVRHRHLGRAFALKVIAPSFRDAGAQRVQVALWLARTSAPGAEVHAFLRLRRLRDPA
ncbi:MAG: hypothetical protein JNK64_25485 [Myxococcales bacterium]|nr:hypothetical protein [Myxococcales bacterium]